MNVHSSQGNIPSTQGNYATFQFKDKCNKILKSIAIHQSRKQNTTNVKSYSIDNTASSLLSGYMTEVTAAVIEEAASLAKHRNSNVIKKEDVNLILGEATHC